MNAEQIRAEVKKMAAAIEKADSDVTALALSGCFAALTEVAAQLAEANEHLAKLANPLMVVRESPWVWLKCNGNPFVIDRNEVTGVALLLSGIGNDRPMVQIGMKGQPWSKAADGTVEEVRKKLGIPVKEG